MMPFYWHGDDAAQAAQRLAAAGYVSRKPWRHRFFKAAQAGLRPHRWRRCFAGGSIRVGDGLMQVYVQGDAALGVADGAAKRRLWCMHDTWQCGTLQGLLVRLSNWPQKA